MSNERHVSYEWVEKGLIEVCERYREKALRLIQDAEDSDKAQVCDTIITLIREHCGRLEKFLGFPFGNEISMVLNFPPHERDKIDGGFLKKITKQTDRFRKLIISISRAKSIEERMSQAPFMIGGVLKCIENLDVEVEAVLEVIEDVPFKEITEEEYELLNKYFYKIISFDKEIPPRKLKKVISYAMRCEGIYQYIKLGKFLGLNINVFELLNDKTVPIDPKLKAAYVKIWNWLFETLIELVKKDKVPQTLYNAVSENL
ncbi:hypothetical protein ACFL10_00795 [Patescibacteria group bacterium]